MEDLLIIFILDSSISHKPTVFLSVSILEDYNLNSKFIYIKRSGVSAIENQEKPSILKVVFSEPPEEMRCQRAQTWTF